MSKATIAMRLVNLKHGQALQGKPTKLYRCWAGIKKRCLNPRDVAYPRYGGRGIGICTRWLSFENFAADMGEPPSAEHSIDRIDFNGSYTPSNCRWATKKEQSRNRLRRPLTIDGITRLLCEWSEISGIGVQLIWQRLYVLEWEPAKAVYYPRRSQWHKLGMLKRPRRRGGRK